MLFKTKVFQAIGRSCKQSCLAVESVDQELRSSGRLYPHVTCNEAIKILRYLYHDIDAHVPLRNFSFYSP